MIQASGVARLHTLFAFSAFIVALVLGLLLHFHKIVKNDVAQYPDEWLPSVSATIGDWYPERNIFQILIAMTSGPRFALVFLQYYLHHSATSPLPTLVFLAGILRTVSCGGWVYITSSDDHDIHDFMMVLYIVCNVPWMLGGIANTPVPRVSVRKRRSVIAGAFFVTLVPLIYFYVQHKVHRVPGAYTRYAFFEWSLILFDILYDSVSGLEFKDAGLQIILSTPDVKKTKITEASELMTISQSASSIQAFPNQREIRFRYANKLTTGSGQSSDEKLAHSDDTSSMVSADNFGRYHPIVSRNVYGFLADIYLSYIFWSIFTSLIPTLFYFSVWKLGIAGHEFALLSVLSPLLLSLSSPYDYFFSPLKTNTMPSSSVLDYITRREGQLILQLVSLVGMIAYLVPSPGGRLVLVSIANIVVVMRQVVVWSGNVSGEGDISYQAIVTGIGLLISSLSKQVNRSNNPVWPFINHKSGGHNEIGIVIAVLAIYEQYTRPTFKSTTVIHERKLSRGQHKRSTFFDSLPLGALLFCLHNLMSDSSTLVAWSWTGYENGLPQGPIPHIHGFVTTLAAAFGILLAQASTHKQLFIGLVSHPLWFLFGTGSTYILYSYRNWTGYTGGLGVAVFLTSILPSVFQHTAITATRGTSRKHIAIGKTYAIAMAVYCFLNLMSIFTVAYAFVPGGQYLRERTDLMLAFQMACLIPAFNWPPFRLTPIRHSYTSEAWRTWFVYGITVIIPLCSLLATWCRLPKVHPQPFKSGTRIFNAGIWTVHFGVDNEGHDSQRGILNLITDMELDIVGLLETDLHRTAFGHRDLTRLIVEQGNYYVDIGPGPNSHTWGAVLLSKFPIISSKHHLLPSPHGELAPAIEAVINIYGTEVLILVAHNGQEEDPLDRELQSTELAKIMAASTRPVVFLGYIVTKPWLPRPNPYGIMVIEGDVHDIDVDDADRWCEYIFYRGLYRTSYARISRGIITDTETQIGQFVVPRQGHNVTDDSLEARYLRSKKEDLPIEHWFPMAYYGDPQSGGVNGHYYHVFNTPLYYKIPEGAVL